MSVTENLSLRYFGTQNEDPVSRRRFLKGIINFSRYAAFATAVATSPTPFFFLPETGQDPTEIAKNNVEEKFGIKIFNFSDFLNDLNLTDAQYFKKILTQAITPRIPYEEKWDEERLYLLNEILPFLPQEMIAPEVTGVKLRFIMHPEKTYCCDTGIYGLSNYHGVFLSKNDFAPTKRKRGFEVVTHELTHLVTKEMIWKPSPEINELLGEDYATLAPRLLLRASGNIRFLDRLFAAKNDVVRTTDQGLISTQELEDYQFFQNISYATSRNTPHEFASILAEYYVNGIEKFHRCLGKLFEEIIVERLYFYVKEKVFKGMEYIEIPIK